MTQTDFRGLALTASGSHSIETFEQALRQLHAYLGDPVETIDRALAEDPDFVFGHIFRAEVHMTVWERSVLPEIETSLARLESLATRATARERAHIEAIQAWVRGDWDGARGRFDRIAADYPRDILALQVGHIADFFHGDRDNLRGRIARALPHWTAADPSYGFLLGMLAFGQEECADYARAEESGRRAIEHEPEDCWAQHAIAHVMEMQGRQAEGIAFMESRQPYWAQENNGFQFHNWWHTAIYNLDQGHTQRVFQIYDEAVRPLDSETGVGGQLQMEMLDAAALLWRLRLRGIDVGPRWQELAASYADGDEAGFYVFNDTHAMMALVASGRHGQAAELLATVERQKTAEGTNGVMTRAVGHAVVAAIEAFGREAYADVVELLLPVRFRAHAFGGSHAQRDIVQRTLLEAACRAGQGSLAEALANERVALKPHCPFSWTQQNRAAALRDQTSDSRAPNAVAAE